MLVRPILPHAARVSGYDFRRAVSQRMKTNLTGYEILDTNLTERKVQFSNAKVAEHATTL